MAALRCVIDQDFAVILLDVRMPIMDGIETAALIRRRRQSEMTPIIFITAHGNDESSSSDRYAAGAVDFIFAPVGARRAAGQGLGLRQSLQQGARPWPTRAREVQTSADQLRLLTDAAPIGIFQTDTENRYVYTNPALDRDHRDLVRRGGRTQVGHHHRRRPARSSSPSDLVADDASMTELSRRFEILGSRPPSRGSCS